MTSLHLPRLLPEYEPTRATLHAYAKTLGTIARAHGIAHPKWWHLSLSVRPEGLTTDPLPLPGGGASAITMDLKRHTIELRSSSGESLAIDLTARPTATELGDSLISAATELGLEGGYERDRYANDERRQYDPAAAEAYYDAFVTVANLFETRRRGLGDRVGPVQVWPHGFDLAFEWFGTRIVTSEESADPAQLNLGLYPGGPEPYFYSSPWPFDSSLTKTPLPEGARWNTDGWSGAYLPYRVVQQSPAPEVTLGDFAAVVFNAARPTLDAS